MNKPLYDALLAKGLKAEDAAEIAAAEYGAEPASEDALTKSVAALGELAKGEALLKSVDELRAEMDAKLDEANSIVAVVTEAADKAISAAGNGTSVLAKSMVDVVAAVREQAELIKVLTAKVEAIGAEPVRKSLTDGAEPAAPVSVDPAANGVIPAPGDATLNKGALTMSEVLDGLNAKFAAADDYQTKDALRKSIALATGGGDLQRIGAQWGITKQAAA